MVIIDEVRDTQYDVLALNTRNALPIAKILATGLEIKPPRTRMAKADLE